MFNLFSILLSLNVLQVIDGYTCEGCGIVIDTDIGGDDAMAISMIVQKVRFEGPGKWGPLLALTTTSGNTGALNATRNAYIILDTLQNKVPVVQGSSDALSTHVEPTYFYGFDGFGDFLGPVTMKQPGPFQAAHYLADVVSHNPDAVTLLFLGPLTNLALALHVNPQLVEQSRKIVILGGVYQGTGNVPNHPGVEANMYSDPDAAAYFFSRYSTADKVTIVPVEAVKTMPYTMLFRLDNIGGIKGKVMDLLNNGERIGNINAGDTWYAYDQSAAAILIDENVISNSTLAKITVITQGPRGAMFAELNPAKPNAKVITRFNQHLFTQLLFKYLQS